MAFVDQKGTANRKTAIIGVAAIHAIIGTVVVTGLAGVVITQEEDRNPIGVNIPLTPPPPPPEPTQKKNETVIPKQTQSTVVVPDPPIDVNSAQSDYETTFTLPEIDDFVIEIEDGLGTGPTTQPLQPTFAPLAAKPSNSPGKWVTQNDYRSSWINREWTGTARFKLSVGTNGRVESCEILASTGHKALDEATCKLTTRRARFNAARDSNGDKVKGSFVTSIKWQLPD